MSTNCLSESRFKRTFN
nr:unnamed protein product [Callosobruchus chinensis]